MDSNKSSSIEFYEKRGLYGIAPDKDRDFNFVNIQNRLRKSLEWIKAQHPKNVLDIGCGDGFFSLKIQKATNAIVWGIDVSFEAIEEAGNLGVKARQCNLNDGICFEDECFDLVFCGEVIEHVLDPDLLLDEIWRVLEPTGILILSTPNLAAWYNRILLLFGVQPIFTDTSTRLTFGRYLSILGQKSQPVGHLRVYTLAALRDILREHQFAIHKIKALPFLPYLFFRQIDLIFGLIPSLGSDLLVIAEKNQ
jgi:2-polyprenyl-3-methyl-5-hydroxy-6-metoxy-1,4-benzoquinol methylase